MKKQFATVLLACMLLLPAAQAQNGKWRISDFSLSGGGIFSGVRNMPAAELGQICPSCHYFKSDYTQYQVLLPDWYALPTLQPTGQATLGLRRQKDAGLSKLAERSSLRLGVNFSQRFLARAAFEEYSTTPVDTFTSPADGMDYAIDSIFSLQYHVSNQPFQAHLNGAWMVDILKSDRIMFQAGISLSAGITLNDFFRASGYQSTTFRERNLSTGLYEAPQLGPHPETVGYISDSRFLSPRFSGILSVPISLSVALGEMKPGLSHLMLTYQLEPAFSYLRFTEMPMLIQQVGIRIVFPDKALLPDSKE